MQDSSKEPIRNPQSRNPPTHKALMRNSRKEPTNSQGTNAGLQQGTQELRNSGTQELTRHQPGTNSGTQEVGTQELTRHQQGTNSGSQEVETHEPARY